MGDEGGATTARWSFDALVTECASTLIGADSTSVPHAYRVVLELLVAGLGVESSFLRHHDAERDASILIAEWPPRSVVPDPDPLGIVFGDDDPAIARARAQREVDVVRSPTTSVATIPLMAADRTLGMLGLIADRDRVWSPPELSALTAVSILLSQVLRRTSAELRLRHLAMHDDLTGLANRRGLMAHLTTRVAEPSGAVAVLCLDIDRLATIGDYLGHRAGDEFLRAVASRLAATLAPDDLVARLEGDQLVLVLGGRHTVSSAVRRADAVRAEMGSIVVVGQERVSRTVSVGVAVHPGHSAGSTPVERTGGTATEADGVAELAAAVLRRADRAALQAKSAGGDAVVAFSEDIAVRSDLRNDVELNLSAAIDRADVVLHFQPEVDLRTGDVVAVEALVRWQHPTRALLPPDDFVPAAESTDLAARLGGWVLTDACRAYAGWREVVGPSDLVLRVNVSPVHLASPGFVESVTAVLERFDIAPHLVCLEVSEVAVVDAVARTADAMERLRGLGVRTAIDHFGTGYSSLLHLKRLPLDAITIDRQFTARLGSDRDDRAIVAAAISLADALDLQVVAGGVETDTAAGVLVELGCHRAQGYLISPPVDEAAFLALLTDPAPPLVAP